MERLGIGLVIRNAGAVRIQTDIWTRYGWIRPPDRGLRGVSLRRSALDPIVRRQAIETPGVDYLPGLTAVGLEGDERVEGVRVSGHGYKERPLMARLVVGADGRDSRWRGWRAFRCASDRTGASATSPISGTSRCRIPTGGWSGSASRTRRTSTPTRMASRWSVGAGQATAGGVPRRSGAGSSRALPEPGGCSEPGWRAPDREMVRKARDAEHGPPCRSSGDGVRRRCRPGVRSDFRRRLRLGVPVGGLAGRGSRPGSARIGSGARSSPGAYARRHRRELAAHHWFISDYSSARRFSPVEKLVYSTAARDAELAGRVEDFASRSIDGTAGTRRIIARAAWYAGLAGPADSAGLDPIRPSVRRASTNMNG